MTIKTLSTEEGCILVSGDKHGSISCRDLERIDKSLLSSDPTKNFLIICGDAGILQWPDEREDYQDSLVAYYSALPLITLYVDGNHENHDLQAKLPVEHKFGGPVGVISEQIYHLKRGYVYSILGYKFFTMGGARSHDAIHRTPGINIWPELEVPSIHEMWRGLENLRRHRYTVDFIITHSPPPPFHRENSEDAAFATFLAFLFANIRYRRWFAGHVHKDEGIAYMGLFLTYRRILSIRKKDAKGLGWSGSPTTGAEGTSAKEEKDLEMTFNGSEPIRVPKWFSHMLHFSNYRDVERFVKVGRKRRARCKPHRPSSRRKIYIPEGAFRVADDLGYSRQNLVPLRSVSNATGLPRSISMGTLATVGSSKALSSANLEATNGKSRSMLRVTSLPTLESPVSSVASDPIDETESSESENDDVIAALPSTPMLNLKSVFQECPELFSGRKNLKMDFQKKPSH